MILTLLLLCAAALTWTDTGVGRALREMLVERPARMLASVTIAPETLTWFVMFDVGVFIDGAIIATAVLSGKGWQAARLEVRRWLDRGARALGRVRSARRAHRTPRSRRPARRPDDSEPRPAYFWPYRSTRGVSLLEGAAGRAHPRPYFTFSMA